MKVDFPLTVADILLLKAGDEVFVTWSGGNGPHRYRITWPRSEDAADVPCVDNLYKDSLLYSREDKRCIHKVWRCV